MSEITDEVEEEFTAEVMKALNMFGMQETPMKIYMALFFADEALGLSEISENTRYSISTVSNNLPLLESLLDINRFSKPGSKKIYWECQHDVGQIQKKKWNEIMKAVKTITEAIDKANEDLKRDDSDKARNIEGHLAGWKKAYGKIDMLHSMFMKIQGILPRGGSKDD